MKTIENLANLKIFMIGIGGISMSGLAKLLIGVGVGKNTVDKRETIKEREWARDKARILKLKR